MPSQSAGSKSSQSWKVLNSTLQKAELRNRLYGHIPSYEEFIAEKRLSREVITTSTKAIPTRSKNGQEKQNNNIPSSATRHNYKVDPEAHGNSSDDDGDEDEEWTTESESTSDETKPQQAKVKPKQAIKENWEEESVSEPSHDEELNEFMEKLSKDLKGNESFKNEAPNYTNLTDYMLRVDRMESRFRSGKPTVSFPRNEGSSMSNAGGNMNPNDLKLSLSLEHKLPLLQVLDTLGDINKILKAGKLTPRMERIMEYKQDHPFREGYEEEHLGCCPWLVYKLERMCKRFIASQWPYSARELKKKNN